MSPSSPSDVTRLLQAWSGGDSAALDELLPVMRSILVDHARARRASKRGGGAAQVTLATADEAGDQQVEVLELDEVLHRLADTGR
jgi:hypothetical protein